MSKLASKVVAQAQAWLGKNESDGSFKTIIDTYNSHTPLARGYKVKYTDEWCATFVSAVAIKCGYTDIIPTECGCDKMIALMKSKGIWNESDSRKPSAGDIIFYDWDDSGSGDNTGSADHVGIVEKVSGNTITVIEGNKGQSVARRTMTVNGRYIRGYGVPKYDKETTSSSTPASAATGSSKTVTASMKASKFKSSLAGTYVTTGNLNMRSGAGTGYRSLVVMPKNTKVKCYGYYSITSTGIAWYYIQTTINGVTYTGFSSSKYLKRQ